MGAAGLLSAHLFALDVLEEERNQREQESSNTDIGDNHRTNANGGGDGSSNDAHEPPATALPAAFEYDGRLLEMAIDLGDRLLPAFDTPTAIPIGTVNLMHGVGRCIALPSDVHIILRFV